MGDSIFVSGIYMPSETVFVSLNQENIECMFSLYFQRVCQNEFCKMFAFIYSQWKIKLFVNMLKLAQWADKPGIPEIVYKKLKKEKRWQKVVIKTEHFVEFQNFFK